MTKKQPHERTARTGARTVDITELEPRLCFSQTPAGVVVPEPVWNGSPDLICAPNAHDAVGIVELDKPHDWQFCAQHGLPRELVIVDSAVDDRERIIAEFASQADANPVSIFILDGARDGVEQITDVLAHFDRVSAIHLFSHGAAGRIQLGNAQLSAESLGGYAAQLTRWQDALTSDADLLIYGCDVASTEEGQELLESMQVLTSADVAASVDLTGHASRGGDWDLEFLAGEVETHATLGPLFAQMWTHDLSIPVSGEQRVNENYPEHDLNRHQSTYRTDRGSDSAVAVANNGKHVVVWTSTGQSTNDDVFFQLYDTDGSKVGSQVLVNDEFTNNDQQSASVAMDANGNFVVVWTSQNQDGTNSSVYYRSYDANGNARGSAARATTGSFSTGEQRDPDVAMNDAGQFAIVWEGQGVGDSEGIFARIFDSAGNPYANPFRVNSSTIGVQSNPAVGIDGVGNIVVAWNQDSTHIAGGYFGVDGTPGPSIDTSSPFYAFLGESRNASVSVREDGLIAIAYERKLPLLSDWHINIQLFNAGLTNLNLSPFPLSNQTFSGDQQNPSVWFNDADDTVVATWDGNGSVAGQADNDGVFARRFRITPQGANNPTGTPLADEFRVNETTSGVQSAPSVAGLDGDNFVVVWSGQGPGDSNGVFKRTFAAAPISAAADTASVVEDSTGILIDVRANDSTSGSIVTTLDATGTVGTVISNADGTFTYRPNGQFESLAQGATATDTFRYTIFNGFQSSTATVTVTIAGQNDAPTSANYVSTTNEDATAYSDSLLSLALDVDSGAVLMVSNPALVSGNAIGVTLSAAAGTISIDPSRYQYLHAGDQEVVVYTYNVIDQLGATTTATATVTINGRDDDPRAVDDSWGLVTTDTAVTIGKSAILANDSDADGDALIVLDYRQPAHGTLVDLGNSLEYTPNSGYIGADSFAYLLADANNSPRHYWRLDGTARDTIGSNHGTIFGTTTVAGSFGNGLAFDTSNATADYVRIPDVTYAANFSISFDFLIDDNNGTGFRYLYSHGQSGAAESVNVFLREAQNTGTIAPNTLATVVDDGNDTTNLNGLDVDASSLIGGWHTYTLTVESGVGTKVYIDGVLAAANSDGGDGVNPTTDVYLGAREDLSSTRFFDGRLDSVRIYDRKLELGEIAELHTIPNSLIANVGLIVADPPAAQNDTYSLDQDQALFVAASPSGLLVNDTGSGTLTVASTPVSGPAHGTLSLSADGSFSYQPNSGYSGPDSFIYAISSAYGGPSQGTVQLTVRPNLPPTAVDDAATVFAGQTISIAAWQNDIDPESNIDLSSYSLTSASAGASVVNHGDGTFGFQANTAGNYAFTYTFRDSIGQISNTATVSVVVSPVYQITGTVYEDVDADGDIADDGVGAAGVSVYLYRDNGNGMVDTADLLISQTTTNGSGRYVFGNLAAANYFVAVDSCTLAPSAGLNSGYGAGDVWADQTYGAAGSLYYDLNSSQRFTTAGGTHFGGSHFDGFDNAATLATSEHVIKVSPVNSGASQADFGFSFNVVTNVLAGGAQDVDSISNGRTVQGSLRQFIANANAISGANTMRFVPADMTQPTAGTYVLQRGLAPTQTATAGAAWWQLQVSTALPALTDAFTIIDGTAYNGKDGVSVLNTNANLLGYRGTVGVYDADGIANSGDEWRLSGLNGPELELVDGAGINRGLHLDADDLTVRHLAIQGFGDSAGGSSNPLGNIVVGHSGPSHVQRVKILDNVLGSAPDAFAAPTSTSGANLVIFDADNGLIHGNLIGFADSWGIVFMPSSSGGSTAWTIESNEIRGNARVTIRNDGIDLLDDSRQILIRGNLIADNLGSGIDTYQNVASHVIEYNSVSNNGYGGQETSGVRLFGSGSQVRLNEIINNCGAGVLVLGGANPGGGGGGGGSPLGGTPASGNAISRNQFGGNGGVAIDLLPPTTSWTVINSGDGVSANNGTISSTSGNLGLDSPEILSATLNGTALTVSGRSTAGARVEVYLAAPGLADNSGSDSYGEGVLFLGQATADAAGNFVFARINVPSLLDANSSVSAIVIDASGNTSEFGKNKDVNVTPRANPDTFSLWEDANLSGTVATNDVDADGDTLFYSLMNGPTHGTLGLNADGTFSYAPQADYHGTDSFVYRVSDGLGGTADATVVITVAPINDIPAATNDAYVAFEDVTLDVTSSYGILLNDIDVDGDRLSIDTTPVTSPGHGRLILQADGAFSYVPDTNFHGSDSFIYRVRDGQGNETIGTVQITVQSVNDAPQAIDDQFTLVRGGRLSLANMSVLNNDFDVDGDALTGHLLSGPTHGQITWRKDGTFDYIHDGSSTTFDTFTYQVQDVDGDIGVATVNLNIQDLDAAPQAREDSFTTLGQLVVASKEAGLLSNDLDDHPDRLAAAVLTPPAHGSVTLNADGTFLYVPDNVFVGRDEFQYVAVDAAGQSSISTVRIDVLSPLPPLPPPATSPPTSTTNDNADHSQVATNQESVNNSTGGGSTSTSDSDAGSAPSKPKLGAAVVTETPNELFRREESSAAPPAAEVAAAPPVTSNLSTDADAASDTSGGFTITRAIDYLRRQQDTPRDSGTAARSVTSASQTTLEAVRTLLTGRGIQTTLSQLSRDLELSFGVPKIAGTSLVAATSTFTVGYVAWAFRAGYLMASVLTTVPTWQTIDPMPILSYIDDEDENAAERRESLESLISRTEHV